MPSEEVFRDRIARIADCQDRSSIADPVHRYTVAAEAAGYVDNAEPGTEEYDRELYDFLRAAFKAVEADALLTDRLRGEIIGRFMLLFGYNTNNQTGPIAQAYDDHLREVGGKTNE